MKLQCFTNVNPIARVQQPKPCVGLFLAICGAAIACLPGIASAQTNPSALSPPIHQDFGTANFSAAPAGFAAWNGINGLSTNTQAKAEISVPAGNATISATPPPNGGAGGCYGYAIASDAHFGVNSSSNSTNGVNQLALAINTLGQTGITLTYDLINAVNNARTVGVVCQYRVGISGGWTTLTGTGNPYVQVNGNVGDTTHASIVLPLAAEGQAIVQVRWAVWRDSANGLGNSSAFAIDNINVTATGGGPAITSLTLSDGPTYSLDDTAVATVTLDAAPASTATINVTSGAFAPAVVTITNPDTTGTVEVSMANAGTFTAVASAATNCVGSAESSSFDVAGVPTAAFAATGNNVVDDSTGNGNGYIDPTETGINLSLQIVNSGTADATGISATLSAISNNVTVAGGSATQSYPDLLIGASGNNIAPFVVSAAPNLTCGSTITLQLAVTSAQGNSTFTLVLVACLPNGGAYDAPADYYTTATGTGATLKTNLHNIVSKDYWNGFLSSPTHKVHTYDDAKFALAITDIDPNNSANVILIYTGASVSKSWDGGTTWNREHQWCDSLGINGTLPAYSDLHHLRPCNPSVNSSRGNKSYGIGGSFWDPDHGLACRGRVARSMFYMNTRYNGTAPDPGLNLILVNGQPVGTTNHLGDLSAMLVWAYAYPIDDTERKRNQIVFSNVLNPTYYQGNRNPFIDHPEYIWAIYGTSANDSTLYVGGAPAGDGSSNASVNLGTVIVGASGLSPQNVTLNKTGSTPTTYDISVTGSASSTAAGTRQAFPTGTQSRIIPAGIAATTSIAGLKSGSIIVHNTDLTSAGAGEGVTDGDDILNVSESVLDHANASFTSPTDANTLTIDFGTVPQGSGVANTQTQTFSIYDLTATPGFTADLAVNSINGTGTTATLQTNVAAALPITNLPAGSSQSFNATLNTSAPGSFFATYTITNADQPGIPGTANGTSLTLTLMGVVSVTCNAFDADCSNTVDTADIDPFVALLLNNGAGGCSPCSGDANNDGKVNGADIAAFISALLGS